ncbi:hypothetical protein [Saccharopolyspora spinosa]|nr:hypothetical protein [Saccharopolyspora spinosa]
MTNNPVRTAALRSNCGTTPNRIGSSAGSGDNSTASATVTTSATTPTMPNGVHEPPSSPRPGAIAVGDGAGLPDCVHAAGGQPRQRQAVDQGAAVAVAHGRRAGHVARFLRLLN